VRGGSYGADLFNAGLEGIKTVGGVTRVVGKVHVNNMPMRLLYKQLGFQPQHLTMELRI
jgi:RimJ/RimL family protein N-acetyltransferase